MVEKELEEIYEVGLEYVMVASMIGMKVDRMVEDVAFHAKDLLDKSRSSRYMSSRLQRKTDFSVFERTLTADIGIPRAENEFLFNYRMRRESFQDLADRIKGHPVFDSGNPRSRQAPPEYQLLVLLKFLGTNGNGGGDASLASHFQIGLGTIRDFRHRALIAVLSLYEQTVRWPSEEERKDISTRIQSNYDFPNCVGLMDGTLLPLEFKPWLYGENYLIRKSFW